MNLRTPRSGYSEMSVEGPYDCDDLRTAIDDARHAAGITDEPYYVVVGVIELLPVEDPEQPYPGDP